MTKIRRSARAFLACVATLVACLAMMFAGAPAGSMKTAQADPAPIPANDQFPAPLPFYTENFENNVAASSTPSSIVGYQAANGATYTAGGDGGLKTNLQGKPVYYWQDPNVCNGFIASANNQITMADIQNIYCGGNSSDGQYGDKGEWGTTDGDYAAVRAKAFALATDSNGSFINNKKNVGNMSNHALSTNTSGGSDTNVPGDMFIIPQASAIPATTVQGRFIDFAVDVATTGCGGSNGSPLLKFTMTQYKANGGAPVTTSLNPNNSDINTCDTTAIGNGSTVNVANDPAFVSYQVPANGMINSKTPTFKYSQSSPDQSWITKVTRGTVYGSQAVLLGSDVSKLGLTLHNDGTASSTGGANTVTQTWGTGSQNGNDGAVDNIRMVDVTPRLTKSFTPAVTSVGATSRLTLTVNNRADNAVKNGWGFTDTLPAGLTFAANPNVGGTCLASPNSATVNPDKNSNALVVTNGILGGAAAGTTPTNCTIQVDVTSTTAALYSNGQNNMSQQVGIDGPTTPATVKFTKGSVRWQKIDSSTKQVLTGSQWQITRTDTNNLSSIGSTDQGTVGPAIGTPFTITDTGSGSSSSVGTTDDYTKDADSGAGYLAVQYLPWGTYSLKETQAPAGYSPSPTTYTFTIGSGGLTTADNTVISNPVGLNEITNSQVPNTSIYGGVRWAKADSSTGNTLPGSEWKITGPSGSSSQDLAVTDCVGTYGTDCPGTGPTGPDINQQVGQFEVQKLLPGSYILTETKAPAGYALDPTPHPFTVTATNTVDLKVLQNTNLPVCAANSANLYNQYSRQEPSSGGNFTNKIQRYDVSQNGTVTDLANLSSQVTRETNGLGISGDGLHFYFTDFNLTAVSDPHIYQYDAQTGKVSMFAAAPLGSSNDNGMVRRGGVDISTGIYYYSTTQMNGSTATNVHNLYAFNPSTQKSWYAGTVTTRDAGASGDLAFDAQGNMYFVVGNNSTAYVNVYSGKSLPTSPNATPIAITTQFLNQVSGTGNGVGIAYGNNGYLYVSNTGGQVYQVDPSANATGSLISTLSIPAGTGNTSQSGLTVDLATCTSPNTLTVKKDYPNGRSNADDNVTLSAWRNTSTQVGQNVDTNGPATGVQNNQLGPVPILVGNGNSYTVRENATNGGSQSLAAYDTSYSCTDTNDPSWAGASGTIPSGDTQRDFNLGVVPAGGAQARAIVCTITNSPISGSVTWAKSGPDGTLLAGSEWTITKTGVTGQTTVTDCTNSNCSKEAYADQNPNPGAFKLISLQFGTYTLTESKAPAGFVKDATPHTFTIDASNRSIVLNSGNPFVNQQAKPPVLPLTGGLSTDAFIIGGAGLIVLSVATALIMRRRKAVHV